MISASDRRVETPHRQPGIESLAPARRRQSFILAWLMAVALAGCGTTSALQLAGIALGGAVGAVLESTGVKGAEASPAPFRMTIRGAEQLNAVDAGEPLSLVVRLYHLRSDAAFAAMSYAQAHADDMGRATLGDDILGVRELTLLPGGSQRLDEHLPRDTRYVGLVALFHSPARDHWKVALDRQAQDTRPIVVTAHACSLTVSGARLAPHQATIDFTRLADIRCDHS